ncbi:hypothetical protein L1887_57617 [Cichorium endivia]|nr:hypothetical protein L1887_57617 [Cichorium endivia]
MSQENCSQEKRFKPNDDLYANLLQQRHVQPAQTKQTKIIEVKPDGTTQLITEPFKNLSDDRIDVQHPPTDPQQPDGNDSFELQPPVIKSDKRKKSSKSLRSYLSSHYNLQNDVDYATVFNTSVNRTNAKRKFEETQRQDLNTLFCDDDMELTRNGQGEQRVQVQL